MCPPEKYAETTYSFRRNCFRTKWLDGPEGKGKRRFGSYPGDPVAKAVHLVRDPFDNIVSRYHLERQLPGRKAASYPETREGFRTYCNDIDSLHESSEKRMIFLDADLLSIMKKVPCHEDFLRYIEWHNLAFSTTFDLGIETFVLHYEWYSTRHEAVAKELLQFLELNLHRDGEFTPFLTGKVYPYFTLEEKIALREGFKLMASQMTWNHIKHYFADIESDVSGMNNAAAQTKPDLPALSSLVVEGSKTDIVGDVQFLIDFAIVGYPKTATSNLLRWLSNQEDVSAYDHEIYHLKDGEPAEMVRRMYELPAGIRGYKAPRDIHNPRAIRSFARHWSKTRLIIGLRHPLLWFESFYNYRIRNGVQLPADTAKLIGECPPNAFNVCTEEIRYHDHLARLGKTPRNDPDELLLLSPVLPRHRNLPHLPNNPVFLYEISEMQNPTPEFRSRLKEYLGFSHELGPLEEFQEVRSKRRDGEIDICDMAHTAVRNDLMEIARRSSTWILKYFLSSKNVEVSDEDVFRTLLESWKTNPCETRSAPRVE